MKSGISICEKQEQVNNTGGMSVHCISISYGVKVSFGFIVTYPHLVANASIRQLKYMNWHNDNTFYSNWQDAHL